MFAGGIITGVILTFLLGWIVTNKHSDYLETFKEPGQVIDAPLLTVFQVQKDGSALATTLGINPFIVYLPADSGETYYDGQEIEIPKGEVLRQIGTFRYTSKDETERTVPVVKTFDKQEEGE